MNRRAFMRSVAALCVAGCMPAAVASERFRLNYAPHAGLFEHSAGGGTVDQIAFAADAGFAAWEDNDMHRRDVAGQARIARDAGSYSASSVSCLETFCSSRKVNANSTNIAAAKAAG